MPQLTCQYCNKNYHRCPSKAKESKFCSKSCKGRYACDIQGYRLPRLKNYDHLKGNQHRKGLKPTNAFKKGETSGNKNAKWVESIKFVCLECGSDFYKKPWETRSRGAKCKFCCMHCKKEYQKKYLSGENSPYYVGGIKTYRGRDWKKIRLKIINRDKGECQKCFKFVGLSIPVHHIKPFREFSSAKEANHPSNLICYCQSCHMKLEPRKKNDS